MKAEIFESRQEDSDAAGRELGSAIRERFDGAAPDAVVLFASPVYDAPELLRALHDIVEPGVLAGCTSAGEFTFMGPSSSSAVALALKSEKLRFQLHSAREISADFGAAAKQLASTVDRQDDPAYPYRAALVLMDTLAGYGEEFLERFVAATGGHLDVFGGGAADDAAFSETFVFVNDEPVSDAVVALEIRSRDPIGIGVSHGWTPASPRYQATASEGLKLREIDGRPAADVVQEFATAEGKSFDRDSPLSFFLHHVIGIESGDGYKLRVPLAIDQDGAVQCAAEVPQGSPIRIMRTSSRSAAEAARVAARRAWLGLEGRQPGVAIFFDCAATRLRLGDEFGASVNEIMETLAGGSCIGCNTYGQFARREGQFGGFHNCTAVVCVLPD